MFERHYDINLVVNRYQKPLSVRCAFRELPQKQFQESDSFDWFLSYRNEVRVSLLFSDWIIFRTFLSIETMVCESNFLGETDTVSIVYSYLLLEQTVPAGSYVVEVTYSNPVGTNLEYLVLKLPQSSFFPQW